MKLLHSERLTDELSSKYLILDSTSLINASQSDDFLTLLVEIKKAGCSFITIPSVVHEFTRGAKTIEQLNMDEVIKPLAFGINTVQAVEYKATFAAQRKANERARAARQALLDADRAAHKATIQGLLD